MSSVKRKILSNIMFLVSGQGLSWVLASVQILILPRYLGPAGLGTLSLMWSISAIVVVVAALGTKMFILREVAREPTAASLYVGPATLLCTGVAIICWSLVALAINLTENTQTIKLVLYLVAAASILSLSGSPLRASMQGMDKMHYTLFEVLLDKGMNTLLILGVVAFNLGIIAVASIGLITSSLVLIMYWLSFLKQYKIKFWGSLNVYQQLLKGGFHFLISDISFNIYLYLDGILLVSLTNETILGYYSVPVRLFGTLLVAPVIVGQALLPTLSRMNSNGNQDSNTFANNFLSFLVCISIPVAVGTTLIAEPFIYLFYGKQYAPSIPVWILLGWTTIPTYLGIGLYQILVSQDKQSSWSKLMIMAIFVNCGLNVVLILDAQSRFGNGAIGAGISQLLTELVIGYFAIRTVGKSIVGSQLALNALKSLVAAIIMGVVIWPLRETFLLIPILVGIVIYLGLSVVLFDLTGILKLAVVKSRSRLVALANRE